MSKKIVNTMLAVAFLASTAAYADSPQCEAAKSALAQADSNLQQAEIDADNALGAWGDAENAYSDCLADIHADCTAQGNAADAALTASNAAEQAVFQAEIADAQAGYDVQDAC